MSEQLANLYTAIAVACRDSDVQNVKALIIGPPETPYEFGFFEVRSMFDDIADQRTDHPSHSSVSSFLTVGR